MTRNRKGEKENRRERERERDRERERKRNQSIQRIMTVNYNSERLRPYSGKEGVKEVC